MYCNTSNVPYHKLRVLPKAGLVHGVLQVHVSMACGRLQQMGRELTHVRLHAAGGCQHFRCCLW